MRSVMLNVSELQDVPQPSRVAAWFQRVLGAVAYLGTDDFADQAGVSNSGMILSAFVVGLCLLAGLIGLVVGAVIR